MYSFGLTDLGFGATVVIQGTDDYGVVTLTTGTSIGANPSFYLETNEYSIGNTSGSSYNQPKVLFKTTPLNADTISLMTNSSSTITLANGVQLTFLLDSDIILPNTVYSWAYNLSNPS
jgi:hypothetical protein